MKTLGLIGAGRWGQNYINTIGQFENIKLLTAGRNDWKQLIASNQCNGVIISTPPDSHIEIAIEALERNIPVIIEKPISLNIDDIEKINNYKTPIIVNYIHLFSDHYQLIKSQIDFNSLKYLYSIGVNNGPVREYSALYDYGPHDIAMVLDFMKDYPISFNVMKDTVIVNNNIADNYNLSLCFKNIKADIVFGNGFSQKNRKFIASTDKDYFIYDDCCVNKLLFNLDPITMNYELPLFNLIKTFCDVIDGAEDYRTGLNLTKNVMTIIDEIGKKTADQDI